MIAKIWLLPFLSLVFLTTSGDVLAKDPIAQISLVSTEQTTAEFEIRVRNGADIPIYFEETRKGSRNLNAIVVEIEDPPGRWTYVGPKHDAAAAAVFELRPGQSLVQKVIVYDLDEHLEFLLATKAPKFRARLRYFRNEEEWRSFGKSLGRVAKPQVVIAEPAPLGS